MMFTFLRKLWAGDDSESERFRVNLERLEAKERELEELKLKLREVSEQTAAKSELYRKIQTDYPPAAAEVCRD